MCNERQTAKIYYIFLRNSLTPASSWNDYIYIFIINHGYLLVFLFYFPQTCAYMNLSLGLISRKIQQAVCASMGRIARPGGGGPDSASLGFAAEAGIGHDLGLVLLAGNTFVKGAFVGIRDR